MVINKFIEWTATNFNPEDIWYFHYATWGLLSFLLFAKGKVVMSIIYLVMTVIAYCLATTIRKGVINENNKSRYF